MVLLSPGRPLLLRFFVVLSMGIQSKYCLFDDLGGVLDLFAVHGDKHSLNKLDCVYNVYRTSKDVFQAQSSAKAFFSISHHVLSL
eukprot:3809143-Amphidinium_carterae.2